MFGVGHDREALDSSMVPRTTRRDMSLGQRPMATTQAAGSAPSVLVTQVFRSPASALGHGPEARAPAGLRQPLCKVRVAPMLMDDFYGTETTTSSGSDCCSSVESCCPMRTLLQLRTGLYIDLHTPGAAARNVGSKLRDSAVTAMRAHAYLAMPNGRPGGLSPSDAQLHRSSRDPITLRTLEPAGCPGTPGRGIASSFGGMEAGPSPAEP